MTWVVGTAFVLLLFLACLWLSNQRTRDNAAQRTVCVEKINQLLPQTQCGECGFDGCLPYAQAIAAGETSIDRCPPGGKKTLDALVQLTGQLATTVVSEVPAVTVASIDENSCIGCVRCIEACPVDAIVGARKQLHHVIPDLCTGCKRCLAPCPVDCIRMLTL